MSFEAYVLELQLLYHLKKKKIHFMVVLVSALANLVRFVFSLFDLGF